MSKLRLWLNQKTYGEADYVVKIAELEVKRSSFRPCESEFCTEGVDLDMLEKYGLAIKVAKVFATQKHFILTKEGNLLCGYLHGLSVIKTKIVIDRNLDFLNGSFIRMDEDSGEDKVLKFLTRCLGMKDGCAVASVKIPDFFDAPKDRDIETGAFSLIFLGDPVEKD